MPTIFRRTRADLEGHPQKFFKQDFLTQCYIRVLKIIIKFVLRYIAIEIYTPPRKFSNPFKSWICTWRITQYAWFSAQRITVVYGIIMTFKYNNQIKGWRDLAMWPTFTLSPLPTHTSVPFNGFDDIVNWLIWFLVQFQDVMLNWNLSIRATISKSMFKTTPSLTHHVGSCQAVILPAFRQSRTSTSWRA